MSKLGVGVGEDFPVDEKAQHEDSSHAEDVPPDPGCCGPHFRSRFGGSHADQHAAWRRFRHQMRAEWRARKRAMREQFRHGEWEASDARPADDDRHGPRPHHILMGALALIGLAALLGHRHHDI
jgi:MYXO-CTERM domain-containing protein